MTAAVDLFGKPERQNRVVRQLALPLGWRAGSGKATGLLISLCNAALIDSLSDPDRWASPIAVLSGPPHSGKSLMARHAADIRVDMTVIDPAHSVDETHLFHACTRAMASASPLIIVADADWQPVLPDLVTRVRAAQDFVVPAPDTELSAALLGSQMAQRHVGLADDVALGVARRIPRDYAAITSASAALADAALLTGRPLSLASALKVIDAAALDAVVTSPDHQVAG